MVEHKYINDEGEKGDSLGLYPWLLIPLLRLVLAKLEDNKGDFKKLSLQQSMLRTCKGGRLNVAVSQTSTHTLTKRHARGRRRTKKQNLHPAMA